MQIYEAGAPWEVLGLDFIGPMEATSRRNRYILTMVDHFSRLTVLAATKCQSAEATVDALIKHWVAYYGLPRVIHSDRGTNFVSTIMTTLCERLGVRRTRTTAYRPQADGRVERTNRTVKECTTRLMHEYHDDWDALLPHTAMAINSTVHESTGFTPFYLAHGCEMQLPVDLANPLPGQDFTSAPAYVNEVLRRFEVAYRHAQQTMQLQAQRAKRRYDATARTISYVTGDKVYYLKHTSDPRDHK
jgi:transposase InsO family protein